MNDKTKKPIVVSACLAGVACRYDCQAKTDSKIVKLVQEGRALPLCPEQLGGLSTPRTPAEQQGDKVVDKDGHDVTNEYNKGAQEALKLAQLAGSSEAILKSKSPMCGLGKIYDGSFTGKLIDGDGVFAKLLKRNGFKITTEE